MLIVEISRMVGGSSSNMVRINVGYAYSPISNALRISLTITGGATLRVDRLTRSESSGDSVFSQLFSIISIRDLMSASSFLIRGPCRSG